MALTSNPYFRAGVEFVHDIAAGAYPGAVLAAWMIRQRVGGALPNSVPTIQKASVSLWLILIGSLLLLAITGGFRLGYWQLNIRQGFLATKKRMILIKHTAFVLTVAASLVLMFTLLPS